MKNPEHRSVTMLPTRCTPDASAGLRRLSMTRGVIWMRDDKTAEDAEKRRAASF